MNMNTINKKKKFVIADTGKEFETREEAEASIKADLEVAEEKFEAINLNDLYFVQSKDGVIKEIEGWLSFSKGEEKSFESEEEANNFIQEILLGHYDNKFKAE